MKNEKDLRFFTCFFDKLLSFGFFDVSQKLKVFEKKQQFERNLPKEKVRARFLRVSRAEQAGTHISQGWLARVKVNAIKNFANVPLKHSSRVRALRVRSLCTFIVPKIPRVVYPSPVIAILHNRSVFFRANEAMCVRRS